MDVTVSFIGTIIRAVVLIACVMLVINVGKKAYDFGFRVFTEGPVAEEPGRDIIVSVDDGEGFRDIAMAVLTKADVETEEEDNGEYIPPELKEELSETYDGTMPVESGSELVEGDLEEGETPYEGEDGSIEIEEEAYQGEGDEPQIDIEVGE